MKIQILKRILEPENKIPFQLQDAVTGNHCWSLVEEHSFGHQFNVYKGILVLDAFALFNDTKL